MFGDLLMDHNGKKQPKKGFPPPQRYFPDIEKITYRFDNSLIPQNGPSIPQNHHTIQKTQNFSQRKRSRSENGENVSGSSPRYSKLVEGARGHLRCLSEIMGSPEWWDAALEQMEKKTG